MKLKEWREKKDLSGQQAAELIGVSQPTISRIETDKLWPDKETMEKIVSATGGEVTPNDFVDCEIDLPVTEAAE